MREEQIYTVFNEFDTDNSGFITKQNFYEALKKSGEHIKVDNTEVDKFFNKNNKIYYEQFKELIIGESNGNENNEVERIFMKSEIN